MKVVLTSATVDKDVFSKYFNDCPIIEIQGLIYPVNVIYKPYDDYIKGSVDVLQSIVKERLKQINIFKGHILVFLNDV